MIKKVISLVLVIFFITLTPISSFLQIENNVYAVITFEQDLNSELFKQTLIPVLISSGLVFTNKESADKVVGDTIDWLKQQGFDFQNPNDPEGPKLGEVVKKMLKGAVIISATDQLIKNVIEIPDLFWKLVKSFVDDNYDVGPNATYELPEWVELDITNSYNYEFNSETNTTIVYSYQRKSDGVIFTNSLTGTFIPNNPNTKICRVVLTTGRDLTIFLNGSTLLQGRLEPYNYFKWKTDQHKIINNPDLIGTEGIVDNSTYDWSNVHTQEREIVIPLQPDELGNNPKRDENGIMLPGISTEEWISVIPTEIPNMDPTGTPIEITEPGQLPSVPENPQTIPEKILYTLAETFKKITGIKENLDLENPTIMGVPAPAGTGGLGGTPPPTQFEWGDFGKFFDIFFIFIYFIVILILILLKFLQVVFSNLPNIPPNPELFNNYPTILEGVNFIKNLKVGGLSITVQQAFEYIFLIFFFIFILKQIRKLYGAYVYEENERSKLESGISGANYERRYSKTNNSSIIDKGHNSNYTGYSKGNIFYDAINNPDDYENINITDYTRE